MIKKHIGNKYYIGLIILITILVYFPTFENEFTNWDDQFQIINNPDIKALSFGNIKTIFSSFYVGMYQPITTLCFNIEYSLFGLNATAYHTVSLLFHLLNIILVFWLISIVTKRKDLAILMACIFAAHPMFVEAVAWVSARSTLMFSCFYLGSIISYLYFLKYNKKAYFTFTLVLFLMSLLSKVMAITLPVLLLLFDFYYDRKLFSKKLILEKAPFFILSIIFGIVAIYGRQIEGHFTEGFTFFDKLFVMSYQLLWYVVKFFSPTNLSAFYPNPEKVNTLLPISYYISPFLIGIAGLIIYKLRTHLKIILLGTFFFLIHIGLVLKIIQVGNQLTTDRYTYIPYIGLLILLSFLYIKKIEKYKHLKTTFKLIVFGTFITFCILSHQQVKIWNTSNSLWSNVIDKNNNVALAHTNLGVTYVGVDNFKAEKYFKKSIEVDSNFVIPYNNLGYLYLNKNKQKAEEYLFKAIEVDSTYLYIYTNLAQLYMNTDKEKSKHYILKAKSINPNNGYVKQRIDSWNARWLNVINKNNLAD